MAGKRYGVSVELIRFWDQQLQSDIDMLYHHHQRWADNYLLARNSGEGKLRGNLVAEFGRVIKQRLLSKELSVNVGTDNPDKKNQAEDYEIVASSVCRTAGLRAALKEAVEPAMWAQNGWLEMCHPMDPFLLDPTKSLSAPRIEAEGELKDAWVETSPDFLTSTPPEFDPLEKANIMEDVDEGSVMGDSDFGYPFAVPVDPRYIIFPYKAKNAFTCDYIARLRFLTKEELKAMRGVDLPANVSSPSKTLEIFSEVEGLDVSLYPNMVCVVDFHLRRDRNNPRFNNFFVRWVVGCPECVLDNGPNPWGAMVPLERLSLQEEKRMTDTALVEEVKEYALLYDIGIQALSVHLYDQLAKKYWVNKNAGLDDTSKRAYLDPKYKGEIKVNDIGAIKEIDRPFNRDLFNSLTFFKSLAQGTMNLSDLDQGAAIKGITARQTDALLTATGIQIDSMKEVIEKMAARCLQKLMYLHGMFGINVPRKFSFGGKEVNLDRARYDFTTSYEYKVEVFDSESQATSEDMITWLQYLKVLGTPVGQVMLSRLDPADLVRITNRRFGVSVAPMPAPTDPGAGMPTSMGPLAPGMGPGLQENVMGQHPERDLGSRGVGSGNMQNSLTGMLKTGS